MPINMQVEYPKLVNENIRLTYENENLKALNKKFVNIGSTILGVMALERMERYDIAERLKKVILENQ